MERDGKQADFFLNCHLPNYSFMWNEQLVTSKLTADLQLG